MCRNGQEKNHLKGLKGIVPVPTSQTCENPKEGREEEKKKEQMEITNRNKNNEQKSTAFLDTSNRRLQHGS